MKNINSIPARAGRQVFVQGCWQLVTAGPQTGQCLGRTVLNGWPGRHKALPADLTFQNEVPGAEGSAGAWTQQCSAGFAGAAVHCHGTGCHAERWQGQKEQPCVVLSHIPYRREVCCAILPQHTLFFLIGRLEV